MTDEEKVGGLRLRLRKGQKVFVGESDDSFVKYLGDTIDGEIELVFKFPPHVPIDREIVREDRKKRIDSAFGHLLKNKRD